ncbi:hypothetical protein [Haladaptatus sp. DJG-WS-42]|uniref:hypothetical protein n=1 Tax=Haladaptatus sp. DJG-WS-42 TaxID=3120516 RepID=UPI0030CB032C
MQRALPLFLALLVSLAGCGAISQTNQQLTPETTGAPPTETAAQNATETTTATATPDKTATTEQPTTTIATAETTQPPEATTTVSTPTATTQTPTQTPTTQTPVTTTATTTQSDTQPAPSGGESSGGSSTPTESSSTTEPTTTTATTTAAPTQDSTAQQTPEPEPLGRFEGPTYTDAEITNSPLASLSANRLVSAHEATLADLESVTSFGRYWSENELEERVFHAEETIEIDESRDVSHLHWADRVTNAGSTTRHFDRRVTTDSWTAYNATTVYPEKPTSYLTGKVCEPYQDDSLRVPVDVPSVADANRLSYLITELDFRQVETIRYYGMDATVYATTDPKETLSIGAETTLEEYRAILVVSASGLVQYSHTSVTLTRDGGTVTFGETRTLRDLNDTILSPAAWTNEVEPGENC